jgi:hypothetical protein
MGLDMMLYRQGAGGNPAEEVMYWRKANAIHKWFVDTIQGGIDECEPHAVTAGELRELKIACNLVLENRDLADDLLPTESGFFFGSLEYDDWYFENLVKTVNGLDDILVEASDDEVFVYQSSW